MNATKTAADPCWNLILTCGAVWCKLKSAHACNTCVSLLQEVTIHPGKVH
jgi:hypothetical protein